MEIMAFVLLLVMAVKSLAVGQSKDVQSAESGFVGESVLLSCPCSDDAERVVWQIGDRLVSHYPQDKNDSPIDESYIKRTRLFLNLEKRNCSLLLISLSSEDVGVYTCHVLTLAGANIWSRNSSYVNLTVSVNKPTDKKTRIEGDGGHTEDKALHIGVPILVIVVILATAVLLTWVLRRRRGKENRNISYVSTESCEV